MDLVLAYFSNAVVVGAICLTVGVIFSQRIKDYINGTPAGFRTAMNAAEAAAKQEVQRAIQNVFARVTATVTPAPQPVAPQPVAPVAPPKA